MPSDAVTTRPGPDVDYQTLRFAYARCADQDAPQPVRRPVVVVATNAAAREHGGRAGALVKVAAGVLGGGGGGKDDLAQGGGADASRIGEALRAIETSVAGAGA